MYKIIGQFYDEEINRECDTPDYAIGVYMAYIQKAMQYKATDAIDEAISVSRDVYTNGLPHYHDINDDMWLELRK